MIIDRTITELADEIAAGEDLGLVELHEGRVASDVVISSCTPVANRFASQRTVAVVIGGEVVDYWYATTHCDSGHLLASLASNDVIVA